MIVKFNGNEYKKNGRNGAALKNLCFDIFKYYLELNNGLSYERLKELFNKWHCNNNFVVLSKSDWENKTDDLKKRYFEPIFYNNIELHFTTQWGNNGGDCDNINNMISFAKEQNYDIKVIENKDSISNIESSNSKTKNIMLYGAPGVGKTHNYKRLITMIENGGDEKTIFDTISKNETTERFDDTTFEMIKKDKRIEFVTFHQSYSYEDFIEGFRPNENGNIELEDGIFKKLCENHISIFSRGIIEFFKTECLDNDVNVENLITNLNDAINYNSEVKYLIIEKDYLNLELQNKVKIKISNDELIELLEDEFLTMLNIETSSNINLGKKERYVSILVKQIIDRLRETNSLKGKLDTFRRQLQERNQNKYLVIDEINRGNISKIFGELITLIEEDKRDSYEVTLPYSKEKFKIPSNLFIIATMNSTDKSIATIDIALRRRFTFLKMLPNLDLVKNEKANKLMKDLNEHISNTIGKDYQLGHSYFMKIVDDNHLEFVKKYKIEPLLEEYFYGDETNYMKAVSIIDNDKKVDNQ